MGSGWLQKYRKKSVTSQPTQTAYLSIIFADNFPSAFLSVPYIFIQVEQEKVDVYYAVASDELAEAGLSETTG